MPRQAFVATAFAAGALLAGPAMAQSAQPMDGASNWAAHRAERRGDLYTSALNTLYAHGFHGVQHLSLMNGEVQATAITPNGTPRSVTVNPGTHEISLG